VVLLVAGANLPEQIAEGFNLSKIPIILALVALWEWASSTTW